MAASVIVYTTGAPTVRPKQGPSHRETTSTARDRIEHRPMPMPTVRKARAAEPWHDAERDPSGGRHRVTRRIDPVVAWEAAIADALDVFGGAA